MSVVTTLTGHIGRHLLPLLLAAGEDIRVIVRDASRLPAAAAIEGTTFRQWAEDELRPAILG